MSTKRYTYIDSICNIYSTVGRPIVCGDQHHQAPAVRASAGKQCRQLELTNYPELAEEIQVEIFFQTEHNLH